MRNFITEEELTDVALQGNEVLDGGRSCFCSQVFEGEMNHDLCDGGIQSNLMMG
jgi:hypothetical protein